MLHGPARASVHLRCHEAQSCARAANALMPGAWLGLDCVSLVFFELFASSPLSRYHLAYSLILCQVQSHFLRAVVIIFPI